MTKKAQVAALDTDDVTTVSSYAAVAQCKKGHVSPLHSFLSNMKVPFSGLGVAMTKDPATLMVGQYFKRKRDIMEIALTSATGIGLAAISAFLMLSAG